MSRNRKGQKLDLKLNLSLLPTRGDTSRRTVAAAPDVASPHGYLSSSSSPSSCLSSEAEVGPNSPEATSMVVAGCPRCLMYVMLSEDHLRCPKCGSTVLLDFCNGTTTTISAANKNNKHGNKKSRMS